MRSNVVSLIYNYCMFDTYILISYILQCYSKQAVNGNTVKKDTLPAVGLQLPRAGGIYDLEYIIIFSHLT